MVIELNGQQWHVDLSVAHDLSIPLRFDSAQPSFFAAPAASSTPYKLDEFSGDVNTGASCNCSTQTLTPHCNGTHTECVGHITREAVSIRDIAPTTLLPAILISVCPNKPANTRDALGSASQQEDALIDQDLLINKIDAINGQSFLPATALIVRTIPNGDGKKSMNYDAFCPPYFTVQAIQSLVVRGIQHLLVDLPSIDRAHDQGGLAAHRAFWGLPMGSTDARQAAHSNATITEMCFIDDGVADGHYLLNLQVAPFTVDAAPSRPILYPMRIQR
jgi:arylformamidase